LQRGRQELRGRLVRRGVTGASAVALVALVPGLGSATLPPGLVARTVQGHAIPSDVPDRVAALVREQLRCQIPALLAAGVALGVCVAVLGAFLLPMALGEVTSQPRAAPAWLPQRRLEIPDLHVWTVAFSPDGKWLAAGAGGVLPTRGELRVWDAHTGAPLFTVRTERSVRCVTYAPGGGRLATAEHDGAARVRDAATGDVLLTLRGHSSLIDTVAFSPDGKMLATSGWDGTVKLWDAGTGAEIRTLRRHGGQVFGVAFCVNDSVASGGAAGTVCIDDVATGTSRLVLHGHENAVHWLTAAPDGQTVATASWDRTVRLWQAKTGKLLATLSGHPEPVLGVAFAADGRLLASACGRWGDAFSPAVPVPGEVVVWDVAARRARARLVHPDRVFGVAISPDGSTVASACWNGAVTLWQFPGGAAADAPPPEGLQFVAAAAPAKEELPAKDYAEDYHPALQGEGKAVAGLEIYGPEAAACVKFEPSGLRFTLPAGFPRQRPGTGVVTDFGVRGDFEITARYEILDEPPRDNWGNPTSLALVVVPHQQPEPDVWYRPNQNRATLERHLASLNRPGQFLADLTKWNPTLPRDKWGNEIFNKIELHNKQHAPTTAHAGRLRLVRRGATLYSYTSEEPGEAFTLLSRGEFGTTDLKNVRVLASTGGPPAALDIRVTDLRIRADGFVRASAELAPLGAPARPWPWRVILLGLGVPVLAAGAGLTAWLAARQRRQATGAFAAPTPAVTCPGCGKRLRVKSTQLGRRLKCPGCGQAIELPSAAEEGK
jgi:hypothetical protein